jgi:hypothetical protein
MESISQEVLDTEKVEEKNISPVVMFQEKVKVEITEEENPLYVRAKKVGVSKEQMDSLTSDEARKAFLDMVSPKTNPDARPRQSKPKPAEKFPPMPPKFEIESKLEAQFISQNRAQFDESSLQAELRRINRMYGPGKPVRIIKDMTFKPVKGRNKDNQGVKFLITKITIFMKE